MLFIFNEQELAEHNAIVSNQQARIKELDAARQVAWQDRIELRPEHIRGVLEWTYRMGATFGDTTPAELWFYEAEEHGSIAKRLPAVAVSIPAPTEEVVALAEPGETPMQAGLLAMDSLKAGDAASGASVPAVVPIVPAGYLVDCPAGDGEGSSTEFCHSLDEAQRAPAGATITALYGGPLDAPAACEHCRGAGVDWSRT